MDASDGEWVELATPDGNTRRVWRPDAQPPSPDGQFGTWYVVTDGGSDRWEWVSAWRWTEAEAEPATVQPALPVQPAEQRLLTRRFVIGWGAAATLTAVVVLGVAAVRDGGSARAQPATAAELAREIGVSFGRYEILDEGYLGRSGGLVVTIINQGGSTRTFWITIEAAGPGGVLAAETIAVRDLGPGRTTSRTAFGELPNLEGLAAARFTVTAIDGRPPPVS